MSYGILYDATLCIGCKQCEQGCATENGLPYDDTDCGTGHHFRQQVHHRPDQRRQVHAQVVHELRRSGLRVGLSGRRAEEDLSRPRDLRQAQMHGMPLLHGRLPVRGSEVRMGQGGSGRAQVHHVRPARGRRQAHGVRGDLSDRRDQVRRARRAAERSPQAHSGQSRQLPSAHLRRDGSRRYVGLAAVVHRLPEVRLPRRPHRSARCLCTPTRCFRAFPTSCRIFGVLLGGVYWISHRREDVAEAEAQEKHTDEKGGVQ